MRNSETVQGFKRPTPNIDAVSVVAHSASRNTIPMMTMSKTCDYGLRAAMFIAAQPVGVWIPIRSIASELDVSFHFLTRILRQLTRSGLLESSRGAAGGVRLARPAQRISLWEIVTALGEQQRLVACVFGFPGCGDENPCPLHRAWMIERKRLVSLFKKARLGDMAVPLRNGRWRISGQGRAVQTR